VCTGENTKTVYYTNLAWESSDGFKLTSRENSLYFGFFLVGRVPQNSQSTLFFFFLSFLLLLFLFFSNLPGDSGGPIILPGKTPEEDVQVGIISWYVIILFHGWMDVYRYYIHHIIYSQEVCVGTLSFSLIH
jgi:hypothetical protein